MDDRDDAQETRTAVEHNHFSRNHGEEGWNERYRGSSHIWSGDPNPVLIAETSDLTPGTALDAGAGEGADALWLASRGWDVTGADLSAVAVDRAQAKSREFGVQVTWLHTDLVRERPPGVYDLVSAFFLHMPAADRQALWRNLAAAVSPGGTLLVVGHDPSDMNTTMRRPPLAEMGWTADEVAGVLGQGWTVVTAEARPRLATDPGGNSVTIHDAVVRARRDAPDVESRGDGSRATTEPRANVRPRHHRAAH